MSFEGPVFRPLTLHIAAWFILVAIAYATAGPYSLASCWSIILIIPPVFLALIGIVVFSASVLIVVLVKPAVVRKSLIMPAYHGAVLTLGLIAASDAARYSAGQVSCL